MIYEVYKVCFSIASQHNGLPLRGNMQPIPTRPYLCSSVIHVEYIIMRFCNILFYIRHRSFDHLKRPEIPVVRRKSEQLRCLAAPMVRAPLLR